VVLRAVVVGCAGQYGRKGSRRFREVDIGRQIDPVPHGHRNVEEHFELVDGLGAGG